MANVKLSTPDKRMLQLIDVLKKRGDIRFRKEFCDTIGLLKQNLVNIKKGTQYFTVEHIRKACKEYNINANWVIGLSDQISRVQAEIHFIGANKVANNTPKKKKKSSST